MNRTKKEKAAADRYRPSTHDKEQMGELSEQGFKNFKPVPTRLAPVEREPRFPRNAEVFRQNLVGLLANNQIDPRDAAKTIGVDRRWFNRLLKDGLQHVSGRTEFNVERVAGFLKVPVEDLWNPNLTFKA